LAIEIKTVGSSGQISLGKRNAGRTVTVEQIEDGMWVVKAARVIPENEMWLHREPAKAKLDRAIEWAGRTPARPTDLGKLAKKLTRRK
jgi:hypothetical protein